MYTVEIGRQFLKLYNKKTSKNYSALEFFEKEFFPVVFQCEDKKQLFPFIHNSAFNQNSYPRLAKKEGMAVSKYRKQRFYEDLELIPKGEKSLSHSALVGAKSGSSFDVTSGQVSNIDFEINKKDIILSWIGGAFGIGLKGRYDLLINDNELLWYIYSGWKYYRDFLTQASSAKGRQLPQWNSCWLIYGTKYKENLERAFSEVVSGINKDNSRAKSLSIRRPAWTDLIFGISQFFKKDHVVLAYAYKFQFGQNFNRTLGFFPIQFHHISNWHEIFDHHLQKEKDISLEAWQALKQVYKSEFGFENACLQGGIGLRSLKPKDLKKYTSDIKPKKAKKEKVKFLIYQTWLVAMLNKKDILELTQKLAKVLYKYSLDNKRGKTKNSQNVEKLWEARNLSQFVDNLTIIMKETEEKNVFQDVVNEIIVELPDDRFKLFLTLTKFNYNSY